MIFSQHPDDALPRIEYANARACEIIGVSLHELTTNPERFYDAAGYKDAVLLALERVTAADPRPAHVQVGSENGLVWLEGSARRLNDAPDGSLRFMTIARDITEQKEAESQRDLLAEAIRRTPDPVFIVQMNGDERPKEVVYANDAFWQLTGYEPSTRYPDMIGEASDEAGIRVGRRELLAGRPAEGETVLYRRDGSTFVARYRAHAIDGPDRYAVMIFEDVTEERERLRALAMLSTAIEQSEDFVGVVDDTPFEKGGPLFIYSNLALQRATGYSAEDLLGKPYNFLHSPNNPAKITESVRDCLQTGKDQYRELLVRRKDGSDMWVEMTNRAFTDPTTNRTLRITVGRDITLRRRAFNQTALLLEASERSSEAVVLYEPANDGSLLATYANEVAEQSQQKRLLSLWDNDSKVAQRIRSTLENGGEVLEVFAENDANGLPTLVEFSARSVRNETRLEAVVTIERVIAQANDGAQNTGQSLLLRVVAMLPALVNAHTTEERIAILRAILLDAFNADLQPSTAQPKDETVHVAPGWKGATFKLNGQAYAARWTRDLDSLALTALRLCIEATIEEERKDGTVSS